MPTRTIITTNPATNSRQFDRMMFRLLIPGLLLPFLLALSALVISSQAVVGPAGASTDRRIIGLVIGVFLFVQLGSQVFSGWFLLRRPASFYDRTLPRHTGVLYAISYVIQLAWLSVIFVDLSNPLGLVSGLALMIISTMVSLSLLGRQRFLRAGKNSAVSSLALGLAPRRTLVSYLIIAAIAFVLWLIGELVNVFASEGSSFNGMELAYTLGSISMVLFVLLGLPWSHTLLGLTIAFPFLPLAGVQGASGGTEPWMVAVLLLSVIVNVAFAIILLRSETRRVRLVNWFFRLRASTSDGDGACGSAAVTA